MGKIYYLDLKTLLETLERQSCILEREIPRNVARLNEVSLCSLTLSQGRIISCVLTIRSGEQYDALPLLSDLYTLENWTVTIASEPKQLSPSLQAPPFLTPAPVSNSAFDEAMIPYLLTQNVMAFLQSLPHKERLLARTLLLHVDNMRSIADIRVQLSFSSATVEQILMLLSQRRIIGFRRRGI